MPRDTRRQRLRNLQQGAGCFRTEKEGDITPRSSYYKNVIRPMAFQRDMKARAVCHICGQPIDYFAGISTTPDSWEGDHLIPIAKGGAERDLANIAASHKRCNRSRGDGSYFNNDLGMNSRIW